MKTEKEKAGREDSPYSSQPGLRGRCDKKEDEEEEAHAGEAASPRRHFQGLSSGRPGELWPL
ncbi:hypothetical protein HPB48_001757 [Haemaphysalis longicornis]|uniref:Uncharacterized protein n=1 Tax=Haemaphysalis longicornis TaxID=44386 RepID=A0A9J6GM77_HAELO|nr:hypothetical protein HPB48_001757 [Haemaphysalis longicornis]